MDENRLALLALHFIPGIGDQLIRQLVSYCGSAQNVFTTTRAKLQRIPGIGEVTAQSISSAVPFNLAEKEFQRAAKAGVNLIFYTDKNYPARLKEIVDAPSVLYVHGNIDFNAHKIVGIVGTRAATDYGKFCVEELMEGLKPHNATIVSGLAYGIDIHAHKMALRNQLSTWGILGSGVDVMYPAAHRDTALKMCEHGGLISENPMGTKPDGHLFPARNRIIAGLADALIVVEAAVKGGALITAEIANSYNKDVFAVPGGIGQRLSEGCNQLIKTNKALLLSEIKDLEYIMNWSADQNVAIPKAAAFNLALFDGDDRSVLKTLIDAGGTLAMDTISWRSGVAINKLASVLLTLEFKGVVQSLPGKCFKLSTG